MAAFSQKARIAEFLREFHDKQHAKVPKPCYF